MSSTTAKIFTPIAYPLNLKVANTALIQSQHSFSSAETSHADSEFPVKVKRNSDLGIRYDAVTVAEIGQSIPYLLTGLEAGRRGGGAVGEGAPAAAAAWTARGRRRGRLLHRSARRARRSSREVGPAMAAIS